MNMKTQTEPESITDNQPI